MPRLPNAEAAIIDVRKLDGYALDPTHPRGRHKARVFAAALGLGRGDAPWLRGAVLRAVPDLEAVEELKDGYGVRWRIDVPLTRGGRVATVRTHWLEPSDGSPPRLVTCYVL
jgi:hypothetical protein